MDAQLLDCYEHELILAICRKVDGIGEQTARRLAGHFGRFRALVAADRQQLAALRNESGSRRLLGEATIEGLLGILRSYDDVVDGDIRIAWAFHIGRVFFEKQLAGVRAMRLQDLDVNPLLARILNLRRPRDIIRFNLYQSVTRSIVTSWGRAVERMLKFSGCELGPIDVGTKGNRLDLKKLREDGTHYFQIKSGPNTMNVGMVESLNQAIDAIEAPGVHLHLGMSYGRPDRISQQILKNLRGGEARTKTGRALWNFIAEEQDYHKAVMDVLGKAALETDQASFDELMKEKIQAFSEEWEASHPGRSADDVLDDYL